MPKRSPSYASAPVTTADLNPADLSYDFVEVLRSAAEAEGLTKGQRTELRLKAGAAAILSATNYQSMRVADVAAHAEVSHGLFYHYFRDKEAITLAVLTELLTHGEKIYGTIRSSEDAYATLFIPNRFYVDVFDRNRGLMRACLTLADEMETFLEIWNASVDRWHRRIASSIRRNAKNPARLPNADLVAYSIGGMIDQLCRLVYVQKNPFIADLTADPNEIAEVISILWFRALYMSDPTPEQVARCRREYGRRR